MHGKVDGAFDSGYLMTAVVNGRTFRGVLFPPVIKDSIFINIIYIYVCTFFGFHKMKLYVCILYVKGPSHVGRGPKNSEREGYVVHHQHQVVMNPRTIINHSDHQMPTKLETSEIRAVNLRRSSPVVRSSTSLDMVDVKHRNELQGVVLTLGGPGNGNGNRSHS